MTLVETQEPLCRYHDQCWWRRQTRMVHRNAV